MVNDSYIRLVRCYSITLWVEVCAAAIRFLSTVEKHDQIVYIGTTTATAEYDAPQEFCSLSFQSLYSIKFLSNNQQTTQKY